MKEFLSRECGKEVCYDILRQPIHQLGVRLADHYHTPTLFLLSSMRREFSTQDNRCCYSFGRGRVGSLDCIWGVKTHSGPLVLVVPFRKDLARISGTPQPNRKWLPAQGIKPRSVDHKFQPLTTRPFLSPDFPYVSCMCNRIWRSKTSHWCVKIWTHSEHFCQRTPEFLNWTFEWAILLRSPRNIKTSSLLLHARIPIIKH